MAHMAVTNVTLRRSARLENILSVVAPLSGKRQNGEKINENVSKNVSNHKHSEKFNENFVLKRKRVVKAPEESEKSGAAVTVKSSSIIKKSAVEDDKVRCSWISTYSGAGSPLYIRYHDTEWGVPVHDDRALFELLILEGAQAGLSWSTILNKRERYREVFDNFEPTIVATYGEKKIASLVQDSGIVRHPGKISSAVENAQNFLKIQQEFGSFDKYIWDFVSNQPVLNKFSSLADIPSSSPISNALSKDLKKRGFRFVGPTIMYAFMQATGMVNDHVISCFRHKEIEDLR